MVTKDTNTNEAFLTLCNALIGGVGSLPDKSFLLGGGTVPKADALAPLQAYVSAAGEVVTTDAAYRAALAKARAAKVPAQAMVADLKPYLKSRLGKTNPVLESRFGVTPDKPPTTPVATKAEGAAKAKATRAAKKAAVEAAEKPSTPGSKPTI
jgi:hypothetical protein